MNRSEEAKPWSDAAGFHLDAVEILLAEMELVVSGRGDRGEAEGRDPVPAQQDEHGELLNRVADYIEGVVTDEQGEGMRALWSAIETSGGGRQTAVTAAELKTQSGGEKRACEILLSQLHN
ncbi:hypothetical protein ADEAN_000321900 [Angomonas deanei]|uniref:Uncharacterized protein n=1 Tax=Angomonas deanei TaxID=59799 RepID=A0A7G2C9N8_9TRYP|nr:hypothetical protein ADEAN_000321900 [Angomonas deanei]